MRGTLHTAFWHGLFAGIIPAYAGNTAADRLRNRFNRDHPRVCGEHLALSTLASATQGSSPRMRGTPVAGAGAVVFAGIIPAYAGNTTKMIIMICTIWDHPRVCGEHVPATAPTTPPTGSSPRMRGTLRRFWRCALADGIIPAYAGNTCGLVPHAFFGKDHPRVCGEHNDNDGESIEDLGSSPRMRGTLWISVSERDGHGIIPAYAGNTVTHLKCVIRVRDHPRVCGEHGRHTRRAVAAWGSSPRMRGTHPNARPYAHCCGIIPAYAGNTSVASLPRPLFRDHPRVCGEHSSSELITIMSMGSSPRMRGTLRLGLQRGQIRGIIPAYAGNTNCGSGLPLGSRDHPRVCGEHILGVRIPDGEIGIIPAYAGNTNSSNT